MTTYTNINAAVAALIENITSQVDSDVLVCEAAPALNLPDNIIAIGERVNHTFAPHAMVGTGGPGWLIEEFEISVAVSVFLGGDDVAATRERCYTLVNAVMEAVLTDPTLAGSCYMAYPARGLYEHSYEEQHKGRLMQAELAILCRSRP